ncbi:MAG: type II toxin-antitoxin system RelE/ParE family toxin [Methanomicrobiales archaeon]|nr:type II toxin-antitoxin system RelE/ParE family toxin [Methanomicrobiales archaeon]
MSDSENFYRIRSGGYRIIYPIDHNKKSVTIYYVRHRKIAYRNF